MVERAVELPPELADGDAHRVARDVADGGRARACREVGRGVNGCRLARLRPPETEERVRRGDVLDRDTVGRVVADPREVVLAEGGARDDPKALVAEPRDREVALDSAARVQHRGVRDRADVTGDAVRAEVLEELGGSFAGHFDLRKRRLVEQRSGLAAGDVLGADRGRPQPSGPTVRAE